MNHQEIIDKAVAPLEDKMRELNELRSENRILAKLVKEQKEQIAQTERERDWLAVELEKLYSYDNWYCRARESMGCSDGDDKKHKCRVCIVTHARKETENE